MPRGKRTATPLDEGIIAASVAMPEDFENESFDDFDFECQTFTVEQNVPARTEPIKQAIGEVASDALNDGERLISFYMPDDGGEHAWRVNADGSKDKCITVTVGNATSSKTTLVKMNSVNNVPESVAEVLQHRINRNSGLHHSQFNKLGQAC